MMTIIMKVKEIIEGMLAKVSLMPMIVGIVIGYLCHGIIKIAIDIIVDLVKVMLKL